MNWPFRIVIVRKPKFDLRPEHKVVPAFISGGAQYYQFDKTLDTPYERALFAHMYYKELASGVDREYLEKHLAAKNKIYDGKTQKIRDLWRLDTYLEERMKFIIDPDLLWKLASVIYFDNTELPYRYDMKQGMKKIELWKKNEDIEAFFLRLPIGELIPYLKQSGMTIKDYSMVVEETKKIHQRFLTSVLSGNTQQAKTVSA